MFYAYGNLYTWEEGSAEGGLMARYNYKGHYVENFYAAFGGMIEGANGTIIPKITDTGDLALVYTYSTGKHNYWKTTKRGTFATRDYDELKEGKFIDPKWSEIEKKFGPSYDYHLGFAMDIHEGHSYAETWGDDEEIRHGNKTETHYGNKTETHHGDLRSHHDGSVNETFHGASVSSFMGVKSENYLAGTNEFYLGFQTGITLAGFLRYTGGFGIDRASGRINSESVNLEDTRAKIKKGLVSVDKNAAKLTKCQARLNNGAVHLVRTGLWLIA